jgi:hypothetical protein
LAAILVSANAQAAQRDEALVATDPLRHRLADWYGREESR